MSFMESMKILSRIPSYLRRIIDTARIINDIIDRENILQSLILTKSIPKRHHTYGELNKTKGLYHIIYKENIPNPINITK